MNSIFDEPILHIVETDSSLMTGEFDFDIIDHRERTLASVREPKRHLWKKVFLNVIEREFSSRHFMHADGPDGEPLFAVDKHNDTFGKSASIQLPNIGEIGLLKKVNPNPAAATHFRILDGHRNLVADLRVIPKGMVTATWNFRVLDANGDEIAEMLATDPRTLMLRSGLNGYFTLQIKAQLPQEVRVLLVGAFVAVRWYKARWGLK